MPHPSPFSSSASKNTGDQQQLKQVLLRNRNYDATKKKWSSWNKVLTRQSLDDQQTQEPFVYNFTRGGGQLVIHANMLSTSRQRAITDVLMECDNFREYSIQGGPEPRVHFLLHEEATNDFDGEAQPGYCYASIRMKSRPLQEMPEILELSADMQNMYPAVEGCFWNIGVNPILYRDGRDRIGYHADDDQDEQLILTVLVSSPVNVTRRISIRHRLVKTEGIQDGDEELELMLDAGDAYSMDGMWSIRSSQWNVSSSRRGRRR